MGTLKVEGAYPMAFKSFAEVAAELLRFIEDIYKMRRPHSALGYLSLAQFEERRAVEPAASHRPPSGAHSTAWCRSHQRPPERAIQRRRRLAERGPRLPLFSSGTSTLNRAH